LFLFESQILPGDSRKGEAAVAWIVSITSNRHNNCSVKEHLPRRDGGNEGVSVFESAAT
jgi:hypothetical protein